jgi:hypothetical protein
MEYNTPKPVGDIDLIAKVREILISAGLRPKVESFYDTNRFIIDANGKHSEIQRHMLNRYWNYQLNQAKQRSIEERYSLVVDGGIDNWLQLFIDKVLPFIVTNDLPRG